MQGFIPPQALAPNVPVKIYNGPAVGMIGIVNVRLCNRGGSGPARGAIAITRAANAAGIQSAEWVSFDRTLSEHARFEKSNLLIFPGESVYFRSTLSNVSVSARGYERIGTGAAITAAPAPNQITQVFAVTNQICTGNVLAVNRANASARIRVAITSAAANAIPDAAWITFDATLPAQGEAEDQALTVEPGEKVYYWADSPDTSVRGAFVGGGV